MISVRKATRAAMTAEQLFRVQQEAAAVREELRKGNEMAHPLDSSFWHPGAARRVIDPSRLIESTKLREKLGMTDEKTLPGFNHYYKSKGLV